MYWVIHYVPLVLILWTWCSCNFHEFVIGSLMALHVYVSMEVCKYVCMWECKPLCRYGCRYVGEYVGRYVHQSIHQSNMDPASPGSPAMLVGPRQARSSPTRQACTQTALAEKSLHQQAQPSQARHGMAYGIPKHKKPWKFWIFHKTPLHHRISAAAPRGGTFYGWIIRARQSFVPPTLGFGAEVHFPKKTCRFCQSWGTTILQKKLPAKHKHTHIKLIDEAMSPSKSIDLVLDHSFCAFDGPVLWFWKTHVFSFSDDFSMALPIQNHVKAMCGWVCRHACKFACKCVGMTIGM